MPPPAHPPNRRPRTEYGPIQLCKHLGLQQWQIERGLDMRVIPPHDGAGRWPAAAVDDMLRRIDEIKTKVGRYPDMGAARACAILEERFGIPVAPEILIELARLGHIPESGWYKEYTLYDGRALERFTDVDVLRTAIHDGRLQQLDAAAEYMRVRVCDLEHLVRAGRLEPAIKVRSFRQRRRERPTVALYRTGDLDALLDAEDIDWDTVRATPAGKRSPLAALHSPAATQKASSRGPGRRG